MIRFSCFSATLLVAAMATLSTAEALGAAYRVENVQCDGFPRVRVETLEGLCVGLVAQKSRNVPFVKPRSAVQVRDETRLLVADMGGWSAGKGVIWLLDYSEPDTPATRLLTDLNMPHKIMYGPDGRFYVGAADEIFRFELAGDKARNIETVVGNLPHGEGYLHPLKNFVFDNDGNLIVNIGSRSDQCNGHDRDSCRSGEEAALRKYQRDDEANRWHSDYRILGRGLRNSMALVVHESGTVLQAENSIDLETAEEPYEEINVIEDGNFYGWPDCFNNAVPLRDANGECDDDSYRDPWTLLPPHTAPLDAIYYDHEKLPPLEGTLLLSWHGYRVVGNRLVAYPVDQLGRPLRQQHAYYWADPLPGESDFTRHAFDAKGGTGSVAQHLEVVSKWNAIQDVRPEGAPVGLSVADDGTILIADDKNAAILRLSTGSGHSDTRSPDEYALQNLPSDIHRQLIDNCAACHVEIAASPGTLLNRDRWLRYVDGMTLMEYKLLHDRTMPMPPDGEINDDVRTQLVEWARAMVDEQP